jgi:hypothetical protein
MISEQDLQRVIDSRLIEKCHELVFHHGINLRINLRDSLSLYKRFTFPDGPDEGSCMYFFEKPRGNYRLLIFRKDWNDLSDCLLAISGKSIRGINDQRVGGDGLVRIEEDNIVYSFDSFSRYVPGQWEQRVHDFHYGLEMGRKNRGVVFLSESETLSRLS